MILKPMSSRPHPNRGSGGCAFRMRRSNGTTYPCGRRVVVENEVPRRCVRHRLIDDRSAL